MNNRYGNLLRGTNSVTCQRFGNFIIRLNWICVFVCSIVVLEMSAHWLVIVRKQYFVNVM